MRQLLFISLFFSTQAFAKPGWLTRACDRFLEIHTLEPSAAILQVEANLKNELQRNAKYSAHRFVMEHMPLDFLVQRPLGIEILPQLSSDYEPVRTIDLRIFINPEAIDLEWKDDAKELAGGPSLILLFKDEPVHGQNGALVSVQELFAQEFNAVLDKNRELKAEMKSAFARDFMPLQFSREYSSHKLMWVEGDISNFQVKRILLLALDHAFAQLSSDPRYAVKKPPTKH